MSSKQSAQRRRRVPSPAPRRLSPSVRRSSAPQKRPARRPTGQGAFLEPEPCNPSQLCQSYYQQKDPNNASDDCASCLVYSSYLDNCSCRYNGDMCAFAKCVSDAHTNRQECKMSYDALFNTKQDPFEFKDLKNCEIFSYDSNSPLQENLTDTSGNRSGSSWSLIRWLLLTTVVFGLFVWWFYRRSETQ